MATVRVYRLRQHPEESEQTPETPEVVEGAPAQTEEKTSEPEHKPRSHRTRDPRPQTSHPLYRRVFG